jgi:hypothetical protein
VKQELHADLWLEHLKKDLRDLNIGERIILNRILKKCKDVDWIYLG